MFEPTCRPFEVELALLGAFAKLGKKPFTCSATEGQQCVTAYYTGLKIRSER